MKLKIININYNEARAIEAEARMDGSLEPISSVNNTRDTKREDDEENCAAKEEANRGHVIRSC